MEIPLWNEETPGFDPSLGQREPGLTPCLCDGAKGCMIVLPGGGYTMRADHEGLPVAKMLCRGGISAFVLSYRVAPYHDPIPLLDARRAVRTVRAHASQLGIDPHKIGILGFSAGGHLAGSAAPTPQCSVIPSSPCSAARTPARAKTCLPGVRTIRLRARRTRLNSAQGVRRLPASFGTPRTTRACPCKTACCSPPAWRRTERLLNCTYTPAAAMAWGWPQIRRP